MFKVINTLSEFKKLKDRWDHLTEACGEGSIHSTFIWLYTWWEVYEKITDPFNFEYKLFLLYHENKQSSCWGMAPLMIEKRQDGSVLCFIGEGVSDYADFLIKGDRESFFVDMISYLRKIPGIDYIRLQQFPQESPNYDTLLCVLKRLGIEYKDKEIEICPYLRISSDWEEYYSTLRKGQRKNIARYSDQLNNLGTLSYQRIRQVTPELLKHFIRINRARQHSLNRPSLYDNPFKLAFVSKVTERWNLTVMIEASYLALDDEILAYIYGFYYRNNYYYWNLSFNPLYKKYSPGKILICKMLESHHKDKYSEFDLMRGGEPYKFIWTRDYRSNRSVEFKIN